MGGRSSHPGASRRRHRPLHPRAEASDSDAYLLGVGRLRSDRKNFTGLVQSYADAVHHYGLSQPLVLAGGGPAPLGLRRLITELDVQDLVRVEEDISESRLVELYQGALSVRALIA